MENDHHDDGDASVAARSVGEDDSIHQSNTHVIVVGGGPAGLLTAILLRQRGIRVTVLEKMAVRRASVECSVQ